MSCMRSGSFSPRIRKGYARHPETMRWRGKLAALYNRHELLVEEMRRRGYNHASPLDPKLAMGTSIQIEFLDTPEAQRTILQLKACPCLLSEPDLSREMPTTPPVLST